MYVSLEELMTLFSTSFRKIRFDKLAFFPDNALGCFYGTQFEIHCQQLVPVGGNETDSGSE